MTDTTLSGPDVGSRVVRGSIIRLAGFVVINLLGAVGVAIIQRHLGVATYGEDGTVLALIALVSTIAAITFFFAGLPRVGATAASILSTFEPIVAVTLAWLVLDEPMTAAKIAGGALVLAAVVVIRSQSGPDRERQLVAQEAAPS